jgi:NAD(P)-dependent dehydrogenase (short-subunit alcohol dehydrogenase family)
VLEIELEVTRYEDFEGAARQVAEAWGGLDILVNNAGVAGGESIEEGSIDLWHRIIEINTFGVVHGCKAFAPVLRESGGGHIVNIASVAAIVSAPEMASYNVSKAAVVSLSETLDAELAPHTVDVTGRLPGRLPVRTRVEGRVVASANARMIKALRREQETTSQDRRGRGRPDSHRHGGKAAVFASGRRPACSMDHQADLTGVLAPAHRVPLHAPVVEVRRDGGLKTVSCAL